MVITLRTELTVGWNHCPRAQGQQEEEIVIIDHLTLPFISSACSELVS